MESFTWENSTAVELDTRAKFLESFAWENSTAVELDTHAKFLESFAWENSTAVETKARTAADVVKQTHAIFNVFYIHFVNVPFTNPLISPVPNTCITVSCLFFSRPTKTQQQEADKSQSREIEGYRLRHLL
jgi:hypothetical protein